MKDWYHKHLQLKLLEAFRNIKFDRQTNVILTKRELEDLLYLWKNEAPKIWKIDDASRGDLPAITKAKELIKKQKDMLNKLAKKGSDE